MEKALQEENWTILNQLAHRLKPSIFLLGIKELELNISAIESSALNPQDQPQLERLLQRTRTICEIALRKLKELKEV